MILPPALLIGKITDEDESQDEQTGCQAEKEKRNGSIV